MNWYFQDSKGIQGPLTEFQLRTMLAAEFEQAATVRSEDSTWMSASLAKDKFTQIENEGVYLRSNDKIYGPYITKRAEVLRSEKPDRFDSYRIGKEGKWTAMENWIVLSQGSTSNNSNSTNNSSSPTPRKQAVTPLISLAERSAGRAKADRRVHEVEKEIKRDVKSQFGIKHVFAASALLLLSVLTYKLLFDRKTPEERLSAALSSAIEDMHAQIEDQNLQNTEATTATLNQAATEIERLRSSIKETRSRSKQKELEQNLRNEFESMSIRLEGELHILEEKEKARVAAEVRRSEAKQKQEQIRIAATEAQAERKRLCERLFTQVEVNPDVSVRIADILAEFKTSLELRGENYERIAKDLKDQNWLSLINTLLRKNYTELPETQAIESAVATLANYDFQLLLRITDPEILQYFEQPDSEIKIMTTWVASSQDKQSLTLCDRQAWKKHPDGIGLLQNWNPSQGRSVITLISQKHWKAKQKELSDTYDTRVAYLQEKSRIGEIPKDLLPQFYESLQLEFLQRMAGWALGQNPLTEDGSKEVQVRSTNGADSDVLTAERERLLSQFVGKKSAALTNIHSLNLPLRWIPPGRFEMGSDKSETGRGKHENKVKVSLTDGFWISETEVTQGLWKSVMNSEPWQPKVKQSGPRFPATCVTWSDCREFARRLSSKARREKLIPSDWEFTLPTEAQWELACRGGSDGAFSFGSDVAELKKYAWFKEKDAFESDGVFAREVAMKQPNQYGLFDMHGNVAEWCLDSFSEQSNGGTNPLKFLPNSPRIYRGGSWTTPPSQCRSAFRSAANEDYWETDLGFRIVLKKRMSTNYEQETNRRERSNRLGMHLVRIEAGDFYMGNEDSVVKLTKLFPYADKVYFEDAANRHLVKITNPYFLGKHEVTVGQFRSFVEATGYQTEAESDGKGGYGIRSDFSSEQSPIYNWKSPGFSQTDDHPVVNVSWNDAVKFCDWLSQQEGESYRLPTEAEWEFACRAGTQTRYWNGSEPEGLAKTDNVADRDMKARYPNSKNSLVASDGFAHTSPVGSFDANPWGLHDLHGNVLEWCSDVYGNYSTAPVSNPLGPINGPHRSVRGGSWCNLASYCRSAIRHNVRPGHRSYNLGFRVALSR